VSRLADTTTAHVPPPCRLFGKPFVQVVRQGKLDLRNAYIKSVPAAAAAATAASVCRC
jgi:hypothetical protein